MASLIGRRLGQYEILSLLGSGGMSSVYLAHQTNVERDVAIKVIKPDLLTGDKASDVFMQRFDREARTIASLSHPHILKLFDYGRQDDLVYLVTELITNGSLDKLIQQKPLPIDFVGKIVAQIASALTYAHQRGVIHRDLKPQNVLLDSLSNSILSDFGISKLLHETTLDHPNTLLGTPSYMAPELWRGEEVTSRIDVYALGIMLFQMLTGRLPFQAETSHAVMYLHLYTVPPSLHEFKSELPSGMDAVINKALSKSPADRYDTPLALWDDFRQVAHLENVVPDIVEVQVPTPAKPGLAHGLEDPTVSASQEIPVESASVVATTPRPDLWLATGIGLSLVILLLTALDLWPLLRSSESGIVAVGALLGVGIFIIVLMMTVLLRRAGKRRRLVIVAVQLALLIAVLLARTPVLDAYAASLEAQLEQPGGANGQVSRLLHELAVINPSRADEVTGKFNQDAVQNLADNKLSDSRPYLQAVGDLDSDPQINIGRTNQEKAITQYNLGLLHEADGDFQLAVAAYRAALKLDDANLAARYGLSSRLLIDDSSDKTALDEAVTVANSGWQKYIQARYCQGKQPLQDSKVFEYTWYCFILQTTEAGARFQRHDLGQGDTPTEIISLAQHAISLAEANGEFRQQGYFTAEAYYYLALAEGPQADPATLCNILHNYDSSKPRHLVWRDYANQQLGGGSCQ